MDAPTRAEILQRSRLLRGRYPVDEPDGGDDLTVDIADATLLVAGMTGRSIGGTDGEEVPTALVPAAWRAIAIKAEKIDVTSAPDAAEEAASGRVLRTITAGPWSESYFSSAELIAMSRRAGAVGVPQLDPDPVMAELLWQLATDDMRDEYIMLFTGRNTPAGSVTQIDYRRQGGGYGPSPRPGGMGYPFGGGW